MIQSHMEMLCFIHTCSRATLCKCEHTKATVAAVLGAVFFNFFLIFCICVFCYFVLPVW